MSKQEISLCEQKGTYVSIYVDASLHDGELIISGQDIGQAAAGFGNYRDANAMALGVFYRPTDQVMLSMGGSMGNGENLLNVGVSFALDKGISTGKAAMAKQIQLLKEENAQQAAKIQNQDAEITALKEALARIEAKLGK